MKNYFIFSFIVLFLVFQGCLEIKTLITVHKDGSGTIEEIVIMNEKVIEMMKGFSEAFSSDSTQKPEFNIFDEKNLKERAATFGEGVTYTSGEKIQEGNREGFRALYSFRNLNNITLRKVPQDQVPLMLSESTANDFSFKFKKGTPSEITIIIPERKDSSKDVENETDSTDEFDSYGSAGSDSLFTKETLDLMKDLSISLFLRTEGSIVETNAAYVEDPEVTLFQFDFNKLLNNTEDLQELFKLKSADMEEVKNLLKNMPGVKIETAKEIFIKFN